MAKFLKETDLNARIEELIRKADKFLYLVSPYIKLHRRLKDQLQKLKNKPEVQIVVLFREGGEKPTISADDISFLKEFPNILIAQHKDLHAKYYATEDAAILTSLNLYDFSQEKNIESGIVVTPAKLIKGMSTLTGDDAYGESLEYFVDVINSSAVVYEKSAAFDSGFFKKTYQGSTETTDKTSSLFGPSPVANPSRARTAFAERNYSRPEQSRRQTTQQQGYCIRTGVPIPFNPERPMCYEAYQTWAQFGNPDYKENFCHKTGKPTNGETSMRNPIKFHSVL